MLVKYTKPSKVQIYVISENHTASRNSFFVGASVLTYSYLAK